jgi:hypothetical protein
MTATVLKLDEAAASMTFADGLAFIERTRRQLDRFGELPGAQGKPIDPQEEADIRRLCDELEADIKAKLSNI